MLGNHLPRRCGIATFTTDLAEAISNSFTHVDCFVLAMNDPGKTHSYPPRVRFEVAESDLTSYRRAADFLTVNEVDVVSVQHEFGIFGGKAGAHVLELLRELRMPIVTTLHTILAEPSPQQRAAMQELATLSDRLVVMSAHGGQILADVYGIPAERVDLVPHGIPTAPVLVGSKSRLGVEGKSLILTFGLLSPDKGIENVIDALPAIVEQCPDAIYLVLGATHPHVREREGETYRLALKSRAKRLGVDAHVIFHDRFVTQAELNDFLAAADIYITPYLKPEQITSGTLAYAVGAGKAVISTPYSYARELLADGRGVLVPWRDPAAIAREIVELLQNDEKRQELSRRASLHGQSMVWPTVAQRYFDSFERARIENADKKRSAFRAKTLAMRPVELPENNLEHLRTMTDSTGIVQHAAFNVPRNEDGYCIDDNARALLLMTLIEDAGSEDRTSVRRLSSRYLAFVRHAFNEEAGRFRNFMTYGRAWTEEVGSEDCHGRAIWALGALVGRSRDPGRQSLAGALFHSALPALRNFTSPRAWAFGLLGIDEYLKAFHGDTNVQAVRNNLASRLLDLLQRVRAVDWVWFEDSVTYDNARLSQALISAGAGMENEEMTSAGLASLEWLTNAQRSEAGLFSPIGSNGFWKRGEPMPLFDQQPVEAGATVSACLEARRVSGDLKWLVRAQRAFSWFLGQNLLQQSLYDASSGGCRDGLHADRVNENQGAESSLAFQLALLEMREVDRAPASSWSTEAKR